MSLDDFLLFFLTYFPIFLRTVLFISNKQFDQKIKRTRMLILQRGPLAVEKPVM